MIAGRHSDAAMSKRPVTSAAVVLAVAVGGVWVVNQGAGASSKPGDVVTIDRGTISVTVGGVGRVATLTDAARQAVPTSGSGTSTAAPAVSEAVFSPVTAHVTALFIKVGDEVEAGERLAELADDGAAETAVIQARHELASAKLDLAQKRVQDPTRGLPPTPEEVAFARQSIIAAQDQLSRLTGSPEKADLATAQQELATAAADLEAARAAKDSHPDALAAAEESVIAAERRLQLLTGGPDPADLAAAQLDVAQAQLALETLQLPAAGPTAAQLAAADAGIAAATAALTAAETAVPTVAAAIATAQADLARAQADRAALIVPVAPPSAAALAAARLAVTAAQSRLDRLNHPPADVVSTARAELSRAKADLATLRGTGGKAAVAAESSVAAAESRLGRLLDPPPEVLSAAKADVGRASADLAVLRQRGAPASRTDLALAGLRVQVATEQLRLARRLADRLVVRAPASGTVTSLLTEAGSAVDATTPLARVQDLNNLVVNVALTEFDVSRTRIGSATRIGADALGGRQFTGEVIDVALTGTDSGGVVTFPVIMSIDESTGLRPGMSVSARVVTASVADAVRLPLEAIEDREGRKATVSVRTRSGDVEEREVRLGLVGGAYAEVRSGLRAGEKVVLPASDES